MKYATMVHGSPEHNLIDLLQMEINKFYGIERGGRLIRTMAKKPGIQAAIEMSASAIIGAIAGAPVFSGAGLISLDEVFSPEQLVLSIDVRDYAQRVRDGFIFSPDTFSTGTIKKVVEQSEDFLLQPETIENYRKIYWQPMFLERTMLAQSTEQKKLREKLKNFAREKIKQHSYHLEQEKLKALKDIYKRVEMEIENGGEK
jgi:trimethylamine:corrinoid methyltransferase-like protein